MRVHKVPTHMSMPDKIVFGLTAKQLLFALIGCSAGYNIWLHLHSLQLYGLIGMIIRLVFALLPAGVSLVFALVNVAGRPLDVWAFVWLRYIQQPKIYVWGSIRHTEISTQRSLPTEESLVTLESTQQKILERV